jgi:hypothetical protein
MMKTALSIVQSVCRRINHPVPTTLVSVTDPDELQMLELLYAVCEELRQARCWTQLKRKHTFTTVDDQATYPLPADFYAPILGTHWNTDEDSMFVGPESDSQFAGKIYGTETATRNFSYRIFGGAENPATTTSGQMELSPTPSSEIDCAYEYITRTFILPNTYAFPTTPQEAVAADTDLVVFDDDLVKLGLRAKVLEDRGGDYAGPAAEFKAKINQAVNRYKGSYVGSFSRRRSRSNIVIPYKGWDI